jgi:hypothetical protein
MLINYLNNLVRAECVGFNCFKPKPRPPPPPPPHIERCFDFEGQCNLMDCQLNVCVKDHYPDLKYGRCLLRKNQIMCCCRNYGWIN